MDGLVVDPETKQFMWLSLNSGGHFEGRHWIWMDDVRAIDRQKMQIGAEVEIRAPEQAAARKTPRPESRSLLPATSIGVLWRHAHRGSG